MGAADANRNGASHAAALVAGAPHALQLLDAAGRTVLHNAAFEALFGPVPAGWAARSDPALAGALDAALAGATVHAVAARSPSGRPLAVTLFPASDGLIGASWSAADPDVGHLDPVGRLARFVAHDFNNLMTVILGYSEILLEEASDAPARQVLREVSDAAERAVALAHALAVFGGRETAELADVPLAELVAGREADLRAALGPEVTLTLALDPGDVARADREALGRALVEVCRYLGRRARAVRIGSARREVASGAADLAAGPYLAIVVSDDGPRLDPSDLARLFEPFHTAKAAREPGLGLATVWAVLRQAGGYVTAASDAAGLTIELVLPRAVSAPS